MIGASQIRAARSLLALSQQDLADLAKIGVATVKRIEASAQIRGAAETFWKIQTALERAGVEFIPGDATKGPGVRLTQSERTSRTKASGRSKRSG
jgi:transcriptional regulator with XRE-family HTH domain